MNKELEERLAYGLARKGVQQTGSYGTLPGPVNLGRAHPEFFRKGGISALFRGRSELEQHHDVLRFEHDHSLFANNEYVKLPGLMRGNYRERDWEGGALGENEVRVPPSLRHPSVLWASTAFANISKH